MAGAGFRPDLFRGAAEHYDRFRPPYPPALIDALRARVPLTPASRVLDLACGTGQIAFALAGRVGEIWAVDQEPDSVAFGQAKAVQLGVTNVRWITAAAENVTLDGAFDLVAIGNAFHRLDRAAVAARVVPHLRDGGCVALLWGGTPWTGDEPWQRVLTSTLDEWRDRLAIRDREPEGSAEVIRRDPHAAVLRRAGLEYEGELEFAVDIRWTAEQLIGFAYSTSVFNRTAVGEHAAAFEDDLRKRLHDCSEDGTFEQHTTFACELARMRMTPHRSRMLRPDGTVAQ